MHICVPFVTSGCSCLGMNPQWPMQLLVYRQANADSHRAGKGGEDVALGHIQEAGRYLRAYIEDLVQVQQLQSTRGTEFRRPYSMS